MRLRPFQNQIHALLAMVVFSSAGADAQVFEMAAYPPRSDGRGTVVEDGKLPPVKPLLDLHINDTVVTLGGDGNDYLTGSTGEDTHKEKVR